MKFLAAIFCLFFSFQLTGQWEPLHGPFGGNINDLAYNAQFKFAATGSRLFKSSDGKNWSPVEFKNGVISQCRSVATLDSVVIASAIEFDIRKFYISKDFGLTWNEIPVCPYKLFSRLFLTPFGIYVHDFDQLFFSGNEGQSWQLSSLHSIDDNPFDVTTSGDILIASTTGKIYFSAPNDDTFSFVTIPNADEQIHKVFVKDSIILALAPYNEKLYRSADTGQTWSVNQSDRWYKNVFIDIDEMTGLYFMSLDSIIIKSEDKGLNWSNCKSASYSYGKEIMVVDTTLYIGTIYQGVIQSIDTALRFQYSSFGIPHANANRITIKDDMLVVASDYYGIFNYDISSQNWDVHYDDTLFNSYFHDILDFNSTLYVTDHSKNIYEYSDAQQKWNNISDSITPGMYTNMHPFGEELLVYHNGISLWNPETRQWRKFYIIYEGDTIRNFSLALDSLFLYAKANNLIYRKSFTADIWQIILDADTLPVDPYHTLASLVSVDDGLFIYMDDYADSHRYRILRSDDHGITWSFADDGFPDITFPWWAYLNQVVQIENHLLLHASNQSLGILVSPVYQHNWFPFNEGLPTLHIEDIAFDDTYMYAGTIGHGIWRRKISDLQTVSIHPDVNSNAIKLSYPNPANEMLYIYQEHLSSSGIVSLIDLTGKTLFQKAIYPGDEMLNVSNIPAGAYLLALKNNERFFIQTIVIQH